MLCASADIVSMPSCQIGVIVLMAQVIAAFEAHGM